MIGANIAQFVRLSHVAVITYNNIIILCITYRIRYQCVSSMSVHLQA